jgi:DNA-binding MarR family transcriptional regulator
MVTKDGFVRLSAFRYQLRRFLRFSEDACQAEGVSMLQYQLMLHTQGFEERDWASISELADRLQAKPHGVVALVDRCEEADLVRRKVNADDKRLVEVHLTARGRKVLQKLAVVHRQELRRFAAVVDAVEPAAGE